MIGKIIILSVFFLGFSLTPVFALTPNESIHFDASDNANILFMGSKAITNQENPSYLLSGLDDFLILESNLPEKLSDFTISVWVKPDYKINTSAKMSIASNSNSFDLAINNDGVGKNVVMFSIYDGIKWHIVQSKTAIPQEWTQITATYSGKIIKIFVNGAQEGSVRIDKNYSLTHQYGVSYQNSNDFIYSNSNFLIGAYDNSLRHIGKIKNQFSGQIDDLMLYDKIISKDEISSIYQNGRVSFKPIIQSIKQSISNPVGVANEYGFVTDPNNLNDQRIEELSYVGFKIKKSISDKKNSNISGTFNSNFSSSNDFKNNFSQSNLEEYKNHLEHVNQIGSEISEEIGYTGGPLKVCHLSSNGFGITFTFQKISSAMINHLDHGDSMGEC